MKLEEWIVNELAHWQERRERVANVEDATVCDAVVGVLASGLAECGVKEAAPPKASALQGQQDE